MKTIYYAVFDSNLRYASQVWGQNKNSLLDSIQIIQNKALRILTFKHSDDSCDPIYKDLKILKLKDLIIINNCLFVYDHLNKNLPDAFDGYFKLLKEQHKHNTRGAKKNLLNVPQTRTKYYGINAIKTRAIKDWNDMINKL